MGETILEIIMKDLSIVKQEVLNDKVDRAVMKEQIKNIHETVSNGMSEKIENHTKAIIELNTVQKIMLKVAYLAPTLLSLAINAAFMLYKGGLR